MALREFTDADVIVLRDKWDRRVLDVRQAADFYQVSPETIRRVCRRDTYREVGKIPREPVDHRFAQQAVYEEISDDTVAQSLKKLKEMVEKDKKPAGINPMEHGGLDDPGEGAVLV